MKWLWRTRRESEEGVLLASVGVCAFVFLGFAGSLASYLYSDKMVITEYER